MTSKRWTARLQDIYDNFEEFSYYCDNDGIMLTISEEMLNLGLEPFPNKKACWESNIMLTGTDERNDLSVVIGGRKPKQSKW